MNNTRGTVIKFFNAAQENPRKYEVISSNEKGEYFRTVGKSCSPIFRIRVLVWENYMLKFKLNSLQAEGQKIYLAVKKSKHLIITDGKDMNYVFNGKLTDDSTPEIIAIVTLTFANDTHVIIASNKVSEIDVFVTVKDIDEDSTERLFAMLSGIKHDENRRTNGGQQEHGFSFPSLPQT